MEVMNKHVPITTFKYSLFLYPITTIIMHKITWIMVNTDFNIGNQLFTFMNSMKYYMLSDKKIAEIKLYFSTSIALSSLQNIYLLIRIYKF